MNTVFVIPESQPTSDCVVDAIHELRDALADRYGEDFVFMVYGSNRRLACHTSNRIVMPTVKRSDIVADR